MAQRIVSIGAPALAAAILVSCSSSDQSSPTAVTPRASQSTAPAPVPRETQTSSSPSGDTGALDSSTTLGPGQLAALRAAGLRQEAKSMSLTDPPTVELVRWTDLTSFAPTMVTCLSEQGFSAKAAGGTQLQFDQVPDSQQQAYALAIYTCESQYTIHPALTLPPSKDALGKVYDWYVTTSIPCLTGAGIDVAQPPSRATFIEDMYAKSGTAWTPWMSVPREVLDSPSQFTALETKCPQTPDASAYLEGAPAPVK